MSFETRFHRDLVMRLVQARAEKVDQLARGTALDHADYRHRTGVIKGLEEAATIASEVASALFGDDEQEGR